MENEASRNALQGVALLNQTHLDVGIGAIHRSKGSTVFAHNETSYYFQHEESRAIPRSQYRSLGYNTGWPAVSR